MADLLALVPVEREHPDGYDRNLFPHWIDRGEGCSTRDVVLRRESSRPVGPCPVELGRWRSAYDDTRWREASAVEIDHVVALKEAWDSGAWSWAPGTRIAFANDLTDPRTLAVASSASNGSKGDADPSNWMPSHRGAWCRYLGDWVAVKVRWGLSMDESEAGRIRNLLRDECPGWRTARIPPLPPEMPATDAPPPPPGDTTPSTAPPGGVPPVDVYYANCDEADAAGASPLLIGEPGYRPEMDGDGDGIACEL